MKNSSITYAWLAVLTVVLAFLYFKPTVGAGSAGAGVTTEGKRIVFVNSDSLLTNYQFYKDAQKEFENKGLYDKRLILRVRDKFPPTLYLTFPIAF